MPARSRSASAGSTITTTTSPRDKQRECFEAQLALAARAIAPGRRAHARGGSRHRDHDRSTPRATACIGVLHCYTGSTALAERALGYGWYVSFSGIITFKNWTDDDAAARDSRRSRCSSRATRRISRPCRGAASATSPRGSCTRSSDSRPLAASTPSALAERTGENARRLFDLDGAAARTPSIGNSGCGIIQRFPALSSVTESSVATVPSDIEIAQHAKLRPIVDVAAELGLDARRARSLREVQGEDRLEIVAAPVRRDGSCSSPAINPTAGGRGKEHDARSASRRRCGGSARTRCSACASRAWGRCSA